MNDDNPSRRGASMIDREPPKRAQNSRAQASDRGCGQPHGLARAVGGLPHAANRRMIGVQEPAYGKCRLDVFVETVNVLGKRSGRQTAHQAAGELLRPNSPFLLIGTMQRKKRRQSYAPGAKGVRVPKGAVPDWHHGGSEPGPS